MLLFDPFSSRDYVINTEVVKVVEPVVETTGEEKEGCNENVIETAEVKSRVTR